MSKQILEKHNGKVPKTFEELEKLPGVGHKTASVVMSQGFGYPAFAVDTHIHRLAQRWGLTKGKNVIQTEKDLKRIFPKKNWSKLHLQIIFYGREYCKARDCYGLTCKPELTTSPTSPIGSRLIGALARPLKRSGQAGVIRRAHSCSSSKIISTIGSTRPAIIRLLRQ